MLRLVDTSHPFHSHFGRRTARRAEIVHRIAEAEQVIRIGFRFDGQHVILNDEERQRLAGCIHGMRHHLEHDPVLQ